jgi:hypothetical protein
MKKKIQFLLVAMFISISLQAADFAGGSGTQTDPYRIVNRQQLDNLRKYLGSSHSTNYYVLAADIDLSGSDWVPVGDNSYPFQGKLYGEGYKIYNLNIGQNGTIYKYTGLFGYLLTGADIDNIYIASGNIKGGGEYTGGIAGYAWANGGNVYIWNCTNNCHITGGTTEGSSTYTGGIAGIGISTLAGTVSIYRCINNGNILSGDALGSNEGVIYAGGITGGIVGAGTSSGTNSMTRIRACINNGTITGKGAFESNTGGIVGVTNSRSNYYAYVARVNILECANNGDVTGGNAATSNTGGLIGQSWARSYTYSGGSIGVGFLYVYDCYSNARVHAPNGNAGGLIGKTPDGGTREIVTCYVAGSITGNAEYAGGLVGYNESDWKSSVAALTGVQGRTAHRISGYGNRESSNYANLNMSVNGNTVTSSNAGSNEGADKTMDELYRQATYAANGWDFSEGDLYWTIRSDNTSLPYYQYQASPAIVKSVATTSGQFNLLAASDSVRIFRYNAGNGLKYLQTFINPVAGDNSYSFVSPMNVNDTIVFVNYHKTDKQWAPSYPVYAFVKDNNGIIHLGQNTTIRLYFDPSSDALKISGLQGNETLRVYNINGQLLLTCKATGETENIPVGHLSSGIYFVKVNNGQALKWVKK